MANVKIADIVAQIPWGINNRRYKTVGALIQLEKNDPSKGPGFVVILDAIFNPAGLPAKDGSISLSCYNPTVKSSTHTNSVEEGHPAFRNDDTTF